MSATDQGDLKKAWLAATKLLCRHAYVRTQPMYDDPSHTHKWKCIVGVKSGQYGEIVYGIGPTWKAALKMARKTKAELKVAKCARLHAAVEVP